MKKLISIMLSFLLITALAFPSSAQSLIEQKSEPNSATKTVVPYAGTYTITRNVNVYNGSNCIRVTVKLLCRDELGNSSGNYILGVSSLTASNVSGWTSVRSSVIRTSTSYSNNNQTAIIGIKYDASLGAGFNTYSTTIRVSV